MHSVDGTNDGLDVSNLPRAQNYIYGQFEDTDTYIDSYEPSTGNVWALIPNSNGDVIDRAVLAAKNAFPLWSSLSVSSRAEYLMKAANKIEERLEEFAIAESRDQGKPFSLAFKMDIPRVVTNLRAFAEGQKHLLETSNSMEDAGVLNYTERSPIGVAGLISPWNLPLYLLSFKIAPALMSGNTVVCKPSEVTSYTAWMLCQVFHDIGLPKGVVNLVCGYGGTAGEALVRHPDAKIISFTGSTLIGKRIAAIAAPMMKRLSLELGGKNAAIVFEDARLDQAIPTLIRAGFVNQGEVCLCTSRIFVHENIYEQFLEKYVTAAKGIKMGRGKGVFMGALVSKEHMAKVRRYINYAIEEGGKILCGETVNTPLLEDDEGPDNDGRMNDGYFIPPTVITDLKDSSRCMQEEIFGPVVCVAKFSGDDEDEVIQRANDVPYGLCASVWTENAGRIHRVASKLKVGTVWQNCWLIRNLDMPFGGCKESGIGREGIYHSLESYTDLKTCCLKINYS